MKGLEITGGSFHFCFVILFLFFFFFYVITILNTDFNIIPNVIGIQSNAFGCESK